jgi:hypothetical protein
MRTQENEGNTFRSPPVKLVSHKNKKSNALEYDDEDEFNPNLDEGYFEETDNITGVNPMLSPVHEKADMNSPFKNNFFSYGTIDDMGNGKPFAGTGKPFAGDGPSLEDDEESDPDQSFSLTEELHKYVNKYYINKEKGKKKSFDLALYKALGGKSSKIISSKYLIDIQRENKKLLQEHGLL